MPRRTGFVLVAALTALATLAGGAAPMPAGAAEPTPLPVTYTPPVDAVPLVDLFRPPQTRYGAGNRGVDYGTAAGQEVRAAADGEVVFAGQVGTSRHVVVLHADGVRTSYSFLAATTTRRGEHLRAGDVLGTTGPHQPLHFGARAGDAYLDPLVLLGQRSDDDPTHDGDHVRLVADPDEHRPLAEQAERRRLLDSLKDVARRAYDRLEAHVEQALTAKLDLLLALADTAIDLGVPLHVHLALAALRWYELRDRCTPQGTPPPDHPAQDSHPPRIALLVGGLGSATGHTAVLDVDTAALGYARGDVHQFSYADEPDDDYGPGATLGDLDAQGRRLAATIADLRRTHPGAPIDVIAHSQGGLVARSAITTHHAKPTTVVTLGTPHQGTDLATAAVATAGSTSGDLLLRTIAGAAHATGAEGIDPRATSIQQMAETSPFIRNLPEEGWDPATTFVVSVAARGDPVVPNHHSRIKEPPAYNTVVVPRDGNNADDHTLLPGSPQATDVIARALVRQPPACRSLQDAYLDEATGRYHSDHEDLFGAAIALGGLYLDGRAKTAALQPFRRR